METAGWVVSALSYIREPADWGRSGTIDLSAWNPQARLAVQDKNCVLAEVLYPGPIGQRLLSMANPTDQRACVRVYNDWLSAYCAVAPERFLGVGLLPSHGPVEWALAEAERLVDIGLRSALVPPDMLKATTRWWDGADPGISRRWVAYAIDGLSGAQAAIARLALLAAMASYQVDAGVIQYFRKYEPSDEQLIAVATWGSHVGSRRIAVRFTRSRACLMRALSLIFLRSGAKCTITHMREVPHESVQIFATLRGDSAPAHQATSVAASRPVLWLGNLW